MTEERTSEFDPNQILLVPSEDEWNLVAQDAEGHQSGVLCPPELVDILKTFVTTSNPNFVPIWRTYSRSMGAGVFFWDVIGMAEGLRDLGDIPGIRRLLRVRSAGELCHNKWQARLMRLAHQQGLGPEMIPEQADRRRPDFRLHSGIEVEIKTLFSETSIELRKKAMRISLQDADRFALGVRRKVADARGQLSSSGIVVVATWCDLTANFFRSFPGVGPIEELNFEPGSVIVAMAPSLGEDTEVGIRVPIDRIDAFCEAAARHLYQGQDLPIPLTGRLVGATRGTRPLSIGRILRTAGQSDDYGAYEIDRAQFRADLFIDAERLDLAQAIDRLQTEMDAWKTLNAANPIAGGLYSAEQINSDPRFQALFRWGKRLCDLLVHFARRNAFEDLLPQGRPRDDGERFLRAVFRPEGPINGEGLLRLADGVEVMSRLSKHLATLSLAR